MKIQFVDLPYLLHFMEIGEINVDNIDYNTSNRFSCIIPNNYISEFKEWFLKVTTQDISQIMCNLIIKKNENDIYKFTNVFPCSININSICNIEFSFNEYILQELNPKIKLCSQIDNEIEQIIHELDMWLANPEKDFMDRLNNNI